MDKLSQAEEDNEEIEPSVVQPRKVPEAVCKARECDIKLRILVANSDPPSSPLFRVGALYASTACVKRA